MYAYIYVTVNIASQSSAQAGLLEINKLIANLYISCLSYN